MLSGESKGSVIHGGVDDTLSSKQFPGLWADRSSLSNSSQVLLCKLPVSFEVTMMPLARWLRGRPSSWTGLFCVYVLQVLCIPDDHPGFSMFLFCSLGLSDIFVDISLHYSKSRHLRSAWIFCSLLISGTVTKIQVAIRDGGKRICM